MQYRVGTPDCRRSRLFRILCVAALSAALASGNSSEVIGYVVRLEGNWVDRTAPAHELRPLHAVRRSSQIEIRREPGERVLPRGQQEYVVIQFRRGDAVSYDCKTRQAICEKPLDLSPGFPEPESRFDQLKAAVMQLLGRRPELYEFAMSRGEPGLRDAVLKVENGIVDLAPTMADLPAGMYHVGLCPIKASASSCSDDMTPTQIEWKGAQAPLRTADLQPGLYEICTYRKAVRWTKYNSPGFVLAVPADGYERVLSEYQEALEMTAPWESQHGPSALRSFRRGVLHHLAREQALAE